MFHDGLAGEHTAIYLARVFAVAPEFENGAADNRLLRFGDLVVDQVLRADREIPHAGVEHRHR